MFFEGHLEDEPDQGPSLSSSSAALLFRHSLLQDGETEDSSPTLPIATSGSPGRGGGVASHSQESILPPPSTSLSSGLYGHPGSSNWIHELAQFTTTERQCPDILPYPELFIQRVMQQLNERQMQVAVLAEEEKQSASGGGASASLLPFQPSDIMQLELQRARFFLTELLRCRLHKIEKLCQSIYYEGIVERQLQRRRESRARRREAAGSGASASQPDDEEQDAQGGADLGEEWDEVILEPPPFPQRANLSANEAAVADRLALSAARAVSRAGLHLIPESLQHLTPHLPDAEGLEMLPRPKLNTYVFGQATVELGVVPFGDGADQQIHEGEVFLVPYKTFRPYVMNGDVRLL